MNCSVKGFSHINLSVRCSNKVFTVLWCNMMGVMIITWVEELHVKVVSAAFFSWHVAAIGFGCKKYNREEMIRAHCKLTPIAYRSSRQPSQQGSCSFAIWINCTAQTYLWTIGGKKVSVNFSQGVQIPPKVSSSREIFDIFLSYSHKPQYSLLWQTNTLILVSADQSSSFWVLTLSPTWLSANLKQDGSIKAVHVEHIVKCSSQ